MTDDNYRPDGTGVVMGDRKPMPDRGTATGFTGFNVEDQGRDLSVDATNVQETISPAADSNPMQQHVTDDPAIPKRGDGGF